MQEGNLEKQARTLISQVRKLRPKQAQREPKDMESEAPPLAPCCTLEGGSVALICAHSQRVQMEP